MPLNSHETIHISIPEKLPARFYLTGYMGAGKTTVGKILARSIHYQFIDTDRELVKRFKKPMRRIFSEEGEAAFRQAELDLIYELGQEEGLVISTGGGTLVRDNTLKAALETGTLIYLKAPVDVLFERVIFSPKDRPMIDVPNAEQVFTDRFKQREPYYIQAHIHVDSDRKHPQRVIEQILEKASQAIKPSQETNPSDPS